MLLDDNRGEEQSMGEMLLPFLPSAEGLLVRRLLSVVVSAFSRGVVLRLGIFGGEIAMGNENASAMMRLWNTNARDKIEVQRYNETKLAGTVWIPTCNIFVKGRGDRTAIDSVSLFAFEMKMHVNLGKSTVMGIEKRALRLDNPKNCGRSEGVWWRPRRMVAAVLSSLGYRELVLSLFGHWHKARTYVSRRFLRFDSILES